MMTTLPAASPASSRLWQLDALRGLMLVLMTLTHVPTRLTEPFGQPFGFVSAAFGFVFISAMLVGRVHGKRLLTHGAQGVRRALVRRAGQVYACHVGLLGLLFFGLPLSGLVGERGALPGMMWFFEAEPWAATLGGLALIHQPGLLDILPMYVVFLLASPLMLNALAKGHWRRVAGLSVALWLFAQTGLSAGWYDTFVASTGFPIVRGATGPFDMSGWQLVWTLGLLGGWAMSRGWTPAAARWSSGWIIAALVIAIIGFTWRQLIGQTPFPDSPSLSAWFDKWHMGPLRLLNAAALLVLVLRFGPRAEKANRLTRPLQVLGRASLPVFCTHVVVAMLVLGLANEDIASRAYTTDVVIVAVTFAALFAAAGLAGLRRKALSPTGHSGASTASR